ncbi:MAG: hypothetical protein OJF55_001673 [Rhodanobacteraceae bacterium]|jgi:uncharacterized protein (DUF58 family)|nr:MAG: hypothetical protein OJF55_001673 [Rhodanobacteraceae bacterium]
MSAAASSLEGITTVSLPDLIALRARAGKPFAEAARVHTQLAGGHVSALRGRGMDYAESRVYQSGDDARNIDWRRTARSGKWHTKLFEAERERSLLLLIDTHVTMRFGTRARFKSVAAARAAAWLAWTCVRGGDRIGALAFGPVRAAIDPHAGTRGALATLGAIARWDGSARAVDDDASGEALSVALRRAQRLVAPGSRTWLFSDGWCTDDAAAAALAKLASHADVRVVAVADALESELAPVGSYLFATRTEQQRVDLAHAAAREQFREQLSQGWRRLFAACDEAGIPRTLLATTDDPGSVLAALWRKRTRRP